MFIRAWAFIRDFTEVVDQVTKSQLLELSPFYALGFKFSMI